MPLTQIGTWAGKENSSPRERVPFHTLIANNKTTLYVLF